MAKEKRSGLTLVETLISIAIFAIIAGVIYLFFIVGIGSWEIGTTRTDLQAQARIATDIIVGELKNTTRDGEKNPGNRCISILPSSGNPPSDNTDIIFYLPEVDAGGDVIIDTGGGIKWPDSDTDYIKYEYVPAKNRIVRKEGAQQRILANDVSNIEVIDAGIDSSLYQDEINLILTLEKTTPRGKELSFTMRSTVKLRN